MKARLVIGCLLGSVSALSWACGSAPPPPAASALASPPAPSSAPTPPAPSSTTPVASVSTPAAAAPAAAPERICSANDQDLTGCEERCAARDAPACETWLKALRDRCQKTAKECTALGRALSRQDGAHDSELDQSFERACKAGDADGCIERGDLHVNWEPKKTHSSIAERSYDRGCTLGIASSCCALAGVYRDTGREKKSDMAMTRFTAAEEKANAGRISCGDRAGGHLPRVRVVAKAEAAAAAAGAATVAPSKAELTALEELLSRRVAECYQATPIEAAHLELQLMPDSAARLLSYTDATEQGCVTNIIEAIHLAGTAARGASFALTFEAISKPRPAKP